MKRSIKAIIFASIIVVGSILFPVLNGTAQSNVLLASVEWVNAQLNPLKSKVDKLEATVASQATEIALLKKAVADGGTLLPDYVFIKSVEAKVHSGALSSYRTVAITNIGQKYKVVDEHGTWYRIEYSPGKYGWIEKSNISTKAVSMPTKVTIKKTTTVHSGALTSYRTVATLQSGQSVKFIQTFVSNNETWLNIELSSGVRGWIKASSGEVN